MQEPLRIQFHGMEESKALSDRIQEKVDKLEQFFDRVTSCQVVVDLPHKHQAQGRIYTVKIIIEVPGETLVVDREPGHNHAHEDAYVALRDAFKAMERRLRVYADKMQPRGVKTHERDERRAAMREAAAEDERDLAL